MALREAGHLSSESGCPGPLAGDEALVHVDPPQAARRAGLLQEGETAPPGELQGPAYPQEEGRAPVGAEFVHEPSPAFQEAGPVSSLEVYPGPGDTETGQALGTEGQDPDPEARETLPKAGLPVRTTVVPAGHPQEAGGDHHRGLWNTRYQARGDAQAAESKPHLGRSLGDGFGPPTEPPEQDVRARHGSEELHPGISLPGHHLAHDPGPFSCLAHDLEDPIHVIPRTAEHEPQTHIERVPHLLEADPCLRDE